MSNESTKYGRSLHAHISLGSTSDDRFMPSGYVQAFANMKELVMTEKLDGQNNCFSSKGLFARSHGLPSQLPWDKPLIDRWNLIKNDLDDLEIFGENMYGVHSIAYKNLESYFYVFGVRQGDTWLSWEDVKEVAALFDFPTVPQIRLSVALKDFYQKGVDENKQLENWLKLNIGVTWEESINTPGLLGGYDPETLKPASEGFVIRNAESFKMNEGEIKVAPNEFANLMKLVRKGHVQTDEHWTKNWEPASLIDYAKYGWYGYEYLSNKK